MIECPGTLAARWMSRGKPERKSIALQESIYLSNEFISNRLPRRRLQVARQARIQDGT